MKSQYKENSNQIRFAFEKYVTEYILKTTVMLFLILYLSLMAGFLRSEMRGMIFLNCSILFLENVIIFHSLSFNEKYHIHHEAFFSSSRVFIKYIWYHSSTISRSAW